MLSCVFSVYLTGFGVWVIVVFRGQSYVAKYVWWAQPLCLNLKGNPVKDSSWPENIKSVQILTFADCCSIRMENTEYFLYMNNRNLLFSCIQTHIFTVLQYLYNRYMFQILALGCAAILFHSLPKNSRKGWLMHKKHLWHTCWPCSLTPQMQTARHKIAVIMNMFSQLTHFIYLFFKPDHKFCEKCPWVFCIHSYQ